jgi:hypothetical protein
MANELYQHLCDLLRNLGASNHSPSETFQSSNSFVGAKQPNLATDLCESLDIFAFNIEVLKTMS